MNTGQASLEWLYSEQLKVDEEWSIQIPNGFKWWADQNAQTISVVDEEIGPDGETGFYISVRTEFIRDFNLTERSLKMINASLMSFAAMSGPVYDRESQSLDLCSLVRVHRGISEWMNPLISVAATLQIAEARIMGEEIAKYLEGVPATSGHPENGLRPVPDEMAEIVATVIAPFGQEPCKWQEAEFQAAVDQFMQQPPSLGASAWGSGFTVEFPFGEQSSLCQVMGDQPHPRYGNGLLLLQSFPISVESENDGASQALSLNEAELSEGPSGYGFGSYVYRENTMRFTSFYPNVIYRPNLLPNIYFACAHRAQEMSVHFSGSDWTDDSFTPKKSAMGRLFDRLGGGE